MALAFHDVRLPDDIERGAIGGPMFKTRVLKLESGFEQRNIDWVNTRGEWDISYGMMNMDAAVLQTAVHDVRDFFYARKGRAHGFRFKDWTDFQIGDVANPTTDNQSIGLGDTIQTLFQVFKRYSSGGFDYDRTIKKLVSGQVVVLLDNVVQVSGFTIQLNAGTITFTSAPGAGVNVQVALEFDTPVRFDDDHFKITIETFQAGQIPPIPIIELRIA